jgi:hypothetical protein
MTLTELFLKIQHDHEKVMEKAVVEMPIKDCFRNYQFQFENHNYLIQFNMITLDFIVMGKMSVRVRSIIKSRLIKEEYLKWKFKKEGRAFFDFLSLYYENYKELLFTDSESPDFIIHDGLHHGYEVTEATDAHNAIFNETRYLLTGLPKQSRALRKYIAQIKMILVNKQEVVPKEAYSVEAVNQRIVECMEKKAVKYREYDVTLSSRNIIIFNNRIGFRRKTDYTSLSKLIRMNKKIRESDIDGIFVISGTHDHMIHFNRLGEILRIW